MLQFPPIPSWDALHPLIIHFPIVLLLLSPLFILVSAILAPGRGRPYLAAALVILLLGTGSLYVAASTGEASAELAERGGAMESVLHAHQDLASETEIVFSSLSAILLGMFVMLRLVRREETRLTSTYLPASFLVLYAVGVLFLINTAHLGGRLVHQYGIHASIPVSGTQPNVLPAEGKTETD